VRSEQFPRTGAHASNLENLSHLVDIVHHHDHLFGLTRLHEADDELMTHAVTWLSENYGGNSTRQIIIIYLPTSSTEK